MSDTGGPRRREPEVRPSKFGAGYTTGGPQVPQPAPVAAPPPAVLPAPVVSELPDGAADQQGTGARAAVQVIDEPAAGRPADAGGPAVERNVLATASLVLVVLLGAFLSPVTIVMAHVARAQIKRTGEQGAGTALAALVVSYVFLFIGVAAVALSVVL